MGWWGLILFNLFHEFWQSHNFVSHNSSDCNYRNLSNSSKMENLLVYITEKLCIVVSKRSSNAVAILCLTHYWFSFKASSFTSIMVSISNIYAIILVISIGRELLLHNYTNTLPMTDCVCLNWGPSSLCTSHSDWWLIPVPRSWSLLKWRGGINLRKLYDLTMGKQFPKWITNGSWAGQYNSYLLSSFYLLFS